ncbi:MAG: glycosyltransferase [Lachnospiraceae bacterium]|nr:glycosyltransferase [Lachnospiraceae bacterium]
MPDIKNKTLSYLKRNGVRKTLRMCIQRLKEERAESGYDASFKASRVTAEELTLQREEKWDTKPYLSVVIPAYEPLEDHFRTLLDSLLIQSFENFEVIIADASSNEDIKLLLGEYDDERLVYINLKSNGGISDNTNEGLRHAKGSAVVFCDHDDFMEPDALYHVAKALNDGARLVYTDEDKYEETSPGEGRFYRPNIKPDFDYDLLLSNNYISHLCAVDMELVKSLGGLRNKYDGSQDYDLILRCVDRILGENGFYKGELSSVHHDIVHIPKVLYHWRVHSNSTAENPLSKDYAYEAGRMALAFHLKHRRLNVSVRHSEHLGFYSVRYKDAFPEDELEFNIPEDLRELTGDVKKAAAGYFSRPEVDAVVFRIIDKSGRIEEGAGKGRKWWDSGVMHRLAVNTDLEDVEGCAYCVRKGHTGGLIVYVPGIVLKRV